MNGKRARKIRKLTNTQVSVRKGYKPELRGKKHVKMIYVPKPLTGELEAKQVERMQIVNVTKLNYRSAKKKLKGVTLPALGK